MRVGNKFIPVYPQALFDYQYIVINPGSDENRYRILWLYRDSYQEVLILLPYALRPAKYLIS